MFEVVFREMFEEIFEDISEEIFEKILEEMRIYSWIKSGKIFDQIIKENRFGTFSEQILISKNLENHFYILNCHFRS